MQTAPLTSHLAAWKWWIIAAVVIGALWVTDRLSDADSLPEQIVWEDSPFSGSGPPRTYSEAMTRSQLAVANAGAAVRAKPDQWLMHEIHASELMARAVPVPAGTKLEVKPWGQKEFSVLDPDHNLLTFGEAS